MDDDMGGTSLLGNPQITTQTPWILPPGPLSQAAAPGDKKGRRPGSQELIKFCMAWLQSEAYDKQFS